MNSELIHECLQTVRNMSQQGGGSAMFLTETVGIARFFGPFKRQRYQAVRMRNGSVVF